MMMRKTLCMVTFATGLVFAGKNDPISPAAQGQLREIRALAAQFAPLARVIVAGLPADQAAAGAAVAAESAAQLTVRINAAVAAKNLLEQSPLRRQAQMMQGCGLIDVRYLQAAAIPADVNPLPQVDGRGQLLPRPAAQDQAFAAPMADLSGWLVYESKARNGLRGFEPHIEQLNLWIAQLTTLIHLAEQRVLLAQAEAIAANGAAQQ